MTRPLEQRSLTVGEAARYFHVSERELRHRIAAGELHAVGEGKDRRVPVGVLERAAAARAGRWPIPSTPAEGGDAA